MFLLDFSFLVFFSSELSKELILQNLIIVSIGVAVFCIYSIVGGNKSKISKKYAELRARLGRKYIIDNEDKKSR